MSATDRSGGGLGAFKEHDGCSGRSSAHAEARDDWLWDELPPRELAEYIQWQTDHVLDDIAIAFGEAWRRRDVAVLRPDEVGVSSGARYFYAIARSLGWDTAQAILGTLTWNDRP